MKKYCINCKYFDEDKNDKHICKLPELISTPIQPDEKYWWLCEVRNNLNSCKEYKDKNIDYKKAHKAKGGLSMNEWEGGELSIAGEKG